MVVKDKVPNLNLFSYILCYAILCVTATVHASYKDDIGFTQLMLEEGGNIPDGSGIPVTQAEAASSVVVSDPVYLPDLNAPEFSSKTITARSGAATGKYSSHATAVARTFYGNASSITPGISLVDAYWSDHWMRTAFLTPGGDVKPLVSASRSSA